MFLGIDCSTQSLKLLVITELKEKEREIVVIFDENLPHYKTINGIIRHNYNGFDHISTPTLLFIEALELAFEKLRNEFDLAKIKSISGSGQQHGSVWWKNGSNILLNKLNTTNFSNNNNLTDILKSSFSLPLSPIWMDSSTFIECDEITKNIGSSHDLANITGSKAYERFTGPQIKHIYKHQPGVYEKTEHISLISSFLASLLIGDYAPIDLSDASGMNLLDIRSYEWNQHLLDIVAPNLREKLGQPVSSDTRVGFLSSYWCNKFGFSPNCEVNAFSGDNPCSLVGLNLNKIGDVALSLGTSDVLFAITNNPIPNPSEGSILIHPQNISNYMMMLVYKNGATTRKFVKDLVKANDNSWTYFNECISKTPAGNNGQMSFFYIENEITPNILGNGIVKFDKLNNLIDDQNINETDCRGIIESQSLSYKYHAKLLGLNKISSLVATGGGSANDQILQIIADVFEIEVCVSSFINTAVRGAALRALYSYSPRNSDFSKNSDSSLFKSNKIIKPNQINFPIYRQMLSRYEKLESTVVNILNEKKISFSI